MYFKNEQNKVPNQFGQLFIEIDGTLKRGGLPVPNLIIQNNFSASEKEFEIKRGQKIKVHEVISGAAATHFTQLDDFNISIKDVVVSRGVQLPKASVAGLGKVYVIKDMSGSASATTITIAPIDGETLDGEPTQSITSDWGVKRLLTDGSNWFTI